MKVMLRDVAQGGLAMLRSVAGVVKVAVLPVLLTVLVIAVLVILFGAVLTGPDPRADEVSGLTGRLLAIAGPLFLFYFAKLLAILMMAAALIAAYSRNLFAGHHQQQHVGCVGLVTRHQCSSRSH